MPYVITADGRPVFAQDGRLWDLNVLLRFNQYEEVPLDFVSGTGHMRPSSVFDVRPKKREVH